MKRRLPVISNAPPRDAHRSPGDPYPDASADAPQLHEAILERDEVDCVLADLDDFADALEIYGKRPNGETSRIDDIVRARDDYHGGTFVALQLLYRFADRLWVDTLLRADGATRMVRMPRDPGATGEG